MSWAGFEPATNRLRGDCSTIELPTHYISYSSKNYYVLKVAENLSDNLLIIFDVISSTSSSVRVLLGS